MTPDDVKSVRKIAGMSQRELAEALQVDVGLVRDWEKGDRFPTKSHCEAMDKLRQQPPLKQRKSRAVTTPMELLGDPGFFALVRKLLVHPTLRVELEKLAEGYPDPLAEGKE